MFVKAFNYLINWLYPPKCVFCSEIIPINMENGFCESCLNKLEFIENPVCIKCGRKTKNYNETCFDCGEAEFSFVKNVSLFYYEDKIRESILEFKLGDKPEFGVYFGKLMAEYFAKNIEYEADVIVSVPMYNKRLKSKGFDHAAILAKELSKNASIPFIKGGLIRIRNTKRQSGLNGGERRENVKDAFACKRTELIKGKKIILIDDIFTTGSTADNCAKALINAGAVEVLCLTLACTKNFD